MGNHSSSKFGFPMYGGIQGMYPGMNGGMYGGMYGGYNPYRMFNMNNYSMPYQNYNIPFNQFYQQPFYNSQFMAGFQNQFQFNPSLPQGPIQQIPNYLTEQAINNPLSPAPITSGTSLPAFPSIGPNVQGNQMMAQMSAPMMGGMPIATDLNQINPQGSKLISAFNSSICICRIIITFARTVN